MQRNLYEKGQRKHPLRRVLQSTKREILLDAPRRKPKSRSSSRPSSSGLDNILILTSSRPNSRENEGKTKKIAAVSTARFYETPKTLLEKHYEQNLSKFLPIASDTEFSPLLELGLESGHKLEEIDMPDSPKVVESKKLEDSDQEEEVKEEMSSELLTQLCADTGKGTDFQIAMLVKISDFFIQKAHSTVLDANDIQGTKVYYSYIKTALKALLILVKKYNTKLKLDLELVICLNIANIYFYETNNLELADAYINRAISLANRNSLTQIAVTSELLYCQILEESDSSLLEAFSTEKHSYYVKRNMHSIAELFGLLRSSHLLVTSSTIGHVLLQSLSVQPDVHPVIRMLSTLYQADLHLYRGCPQTAQELLQKMEVSQVKLPDQFLAMYHLVQLSTLVQANQIKKGREYVQHISEFISNQRKNSWPGWNEDGSVNMHLVQDETHVPFALRGLNSDEFVIMFYFLSGILFLSERSTFKKANKVFTSCLEIIELQLEELTQARAGARNFSLRLLTGKIVRLNYVRYSVYYYKVWLSFMDKNDFSGVLFLRLFINDFDEDNFTKEELSYYKLLIPRFLLLTAMYFQAQGDVTASKYYYLRVRQLCSSQNTSHTSHDISYLQRGLGIGCESMAPSDGNSELFMFATLQVLQITEYEIKSFSTSQNPDAKLKLAAGRNLLGDLYHDLSQALDSTTKTSSFKSFLSSNALFKLSFKVLSCIYLHRGFSNNTTIHDPSLVAEVEHLLKESPSGEFISVLGAYVLYNTSLNLEKRNELLTRCLGSVSDQDDNSKILKVFLLRELMGKESELDDSEECKLLQMQVEVLEQSVREKLKRLTFSTNLSTQTA